MRFKIPVAAQVGCAGYRLRQPVTDLARLPSGLGKSIKTKTPTLYSTGVLHFDFLP